MKALTVKEKIKFLGVEITEGQYNYIWKLARLYKRPLSYVIRFIINEYQLSTEKDGTNEKGKV